MRALCGHGAKMVRLDAYGYVTKKIGTRCFFEVRHPPHTAVFNPQAKLMSTPQTACMRNYTQEDTLYHKGIVAQEPEVWDILKDLEKISDEHESRYNSQVPLSIALRLLGFLSQKCISLQCDCNATVCR